MQSTLVDTELRVTIQRLARRLRAERADTALSDGQLSVLFVLAKEGPLGLTEVSAHERVTPPSMNRTMNSLVAAGYVTRTPSPDDRRKVVLALTEHASSVIAETRRRRDEWFSVRLASLSADERATLEAAGPILRELADS
jgi:DNA-binding MarR family transcriptional regulator